jgi:hypothetical protein
MRGRICLFRERLLQVSTVERGGLLIPVVIGLVMLVR